MHSTSRWRHEVPTTYYAHGLYTNIPAAPPSRMIMPPIITFGQMGDGEGGTGTWMLAPVFGGRLVFRAVRLQATAATHRVRHTERELVYTSSTFRWFPEGPPVRVPPESGVRSSPGWMLG